MSYHNRVEDLQRQLQQRNYIIVGLVLAICLALFLAIMLLRGIRVDVEPGLVSPARLRAGEIPTINVYTFAENLVQKINYWHKNGDKDYPNQITAYRPYITPAFSAWLMEDYRRKKKRGEVQGRTRELDPIPGVDYSDERVSGRAGDWIVWLDFRMTETLRGTTVKDGYYRVGVRVVRSASNPDLNRWGLKVDGYVNGGPVKIPDEDLKKLGLSQ